MKYLIGTGGWAYFKVPQSPLLKVYSDNFDFVEINSTFYQYPDIRIVERWRRTVPKHFVFTVRCHQDLTHKVGLKPVDESYAVLGKMIGICKILDAPFLHLLSPANIIFTDKRLKQAADLFASIDLKGVRLVWEIRGPTNDRLVNLMKDFKITPSVDLSKEEPPGKFDVIYARLFGKGEHNIYQFTDKELVEIDQKILESRAKKAFVTFHGIKMSSDALRFKKYKEIGTFIPVTAFTGINSAKAVLQEDARFPSTKIELLKHQGWKVIDMTRSKRIHLSNLLFKIPERTYNSVEEVIRELKVLR
jgi:uncharacterized protein YecE (DUF72 family)